MLDVNEIMKILPHRYPFLLVDRILELESGKRIVGRKNVTMNEPFFPGHFPGHPVMPGVLIIEAMAQVAAILAYQSSDDSLRSKVTYFVGIDNAKFRRPVVPGDQLNLVLEVLVVKRGIWQFKGQAFVADKLVTEAELKATFADR
jgi:3-hydroxyacyl-[acyl-carrier-protein] dehydratase